ncbi:MAG: MFS transporter [Deltaproteobacteria bacterium]|nr:MFS transporter [Deltaproteobacteria bacterium]
MAGQSDANRLIVLERRLLDLLADTDAAAASVRPASAGMIPADAALSLFEAQLRSRALDLAARRLRAEGIGYYTISSAGHEQNAVLGALLEVDDPCLLHYRAGALVIARAMRAGHHAIMRDVLLSLRASALDPVAQGRHKVWGSRPLWIVPQTSTIASHLPKAVGLAFAISRARRLGVVPPFSPNAIVVCSFGDASANHASALSGIHAARYAHRRGHAVPILFVCEDNGLGISERTPRDWIYDSFGPLRDLDYVRATGSLDAIWARAAEAIAHCRESRSPVFLHLDCVRLGGHAGSDVESAYLLASEIAAMEERDPLLANARFLTLNGLASADDLARLHAAIREEVDLLCEEVRDAPPLSDARTLVAPLGIDRAPDRSALTAARTQRAPEGVAEEASAGTLGAQLRAGLDELLREYPEALIFGEDVGRKGGVYGITAGLARRFGAARVFDTQVDETTILGTAQGLALAGLLPVPEIQYLAYLHNAIDQLRGEACSLAFFSGGSFRSPMLLRIASFAYQKGFGGHFHNENAIGALREIPGLVLAAPAFGDDARRMLRGCAAMVREEGRVVALLEPIALYFERDLYEKGDDGWLRGAPLSDAMSLPGEIGCHGPDAPELVLVSYANGLRLSLRAARRLEREHGLRVGVIDLRWLAPLPFAALDAVLADGPACLVVDECRRTGAGIADAVLAHLVETGWRGVATSVRAADSYVPLGPSADMVLVGEEEIVETALGLLEQR